MATAQITALLKLTKLVVYFLLLLYVTSIQVCQASYVSKGDLEAFSHLTDLPNILNDKVTDLGKQLKEEQTKNEELSKQIADSWPTSGIVYDPPQRTRRSTKMPRTADSQFHCFDMENPHNKIGST